MFAFPNVTIILLTVATYGINEAFFQAIIKVKILLTTTRTYHIMSSFMKVVLVLEIKIVK